MRHATKSPNASTSPRTSSKLFFESATSSTPRSLSSFSLAWNAAFGRTASAPSSPATPSQSVPSRSTATTFFGESPLTRRKNSHRLVTFVTSANGISTPYLDCTDITRRRCAIESHSGIEPSVVSSDKPAGATPKTPAAKSRKSRSPTMRVLSHNRRAKSKRTFTPCPSRSDTAAQARPRTPPVC